MFTYSFFEMALNGLIKQIVKKHINHSFSKEQFRHLYRTEMEEEERIKKMIITLFFFGKYFSK